jgi:hypothetical protein
MQNAEELPLDSINGTDAEKKGLRILTTIHYIHMHACIIVVVGQYVYVYR